jgi:hypothetical protein
LQAILSSEVSLKINSAGASVGTSIRSLLQREGVAENHSNPRPLLSQHSGLIWHKLPTIKRAKNVNLFTKQVFQKLFQVLGEEKPHQQKEEARAGMSGGKVASE